MWGITNGSIIAARLGRGLEDLMVRFVGFCSLMAVAFGGSGAVFAQECEKTFDNTFDLIQEAIFEGRGCNSVTCHSGADPAGGLDLASDDAWENLIDVDVTSIPSSAAEGWKRVSPGQKDRSLLWFNLAAATLPDQWEAPLRAMPIGLESLSLDELEAMRLWIEQGAPKDGVVEGTDELLDACLPEPKPIRINPLPPPDPEVGVQLVMPEWTLPPNSEDEVCFVSYFDISDQVPERFQGEGGETFRYVRNQIRQNPGSHHLIVNLYQGSAAIDDPAWGAFTCKGGSQHGESCAPMDRDACDGGLCGSEPQTSLACAGFGPGDAFTAADPFTGTQESSSNIDFIDGVFAEVPMKGILVWNSHAFNLTNEESPLEAWLNFEYAENPETPAIGIFDTSNIFAMTADPFTADEVCAHYRLRSRARVFELTSHMHQRGQRFQIFRSMFTCQGGPNGGDACTPFGPDQTFQTDDLCAGAECRAKAQPPYGDCDGDFSLDISDLMVGVRIALGLEQRSECRQADADDDGSVSVSDLVKIVKAALAGDQFVDPNEDMVYESFQYNDPVTARYDPPLEFGRNRDGRPARTITYCAIYDNGMMDPTDVKLQSASPLPPNGVPVGGPCATPTGCTAGNVGATCTGDSEEARDASCDSSPGAGDGDCDACVLTGGVTTEDEMFVLIGTYFRD